MQSFTKGCRLAAEASSITRIRIRPVPGPSAWAAITTKALLSVCRPATPSSNPPTIVSSTSTHPLSRSRSGVLNHAHPDPPGTRPIGLGGDHNQSLTLGFPPRHAFLQPANHRLIHLHPSAQPMVGGLEEG